MLDGRREEAKRYTFILKADHLKPDVLADWSGFKQDSGSWNQTRKACEDAVRAKLFDLTAAKRAETKNQWLENHTSLQQTLPKRSQERLSTALDNIMEKCPSLGSNQVQQVMDVLASMEHAESQYALLAKMQNMSPDDFDNWNDILDRWTTELAKEALDEVEKRLRSPALKAGKSARSRPYRKPYRPTAACRSRVTAANGAPVSIAVHDLAGDTLTADRWRCALGIRLRPPTGSRFAFLRAVALSALSAASSSLR